METISLGGRPVAGFAVGQSSQAAIIPHASPAFAALMTGATVGLAAYVFKAPLWGSILAGSGAAAATKWGIDRAAATA
jgi:hypothetical protein